MSTLAQAVAEAKVILARAEALDELPPAVREATVATPGTIHFADRDVAVQLLAVFVEVIERLDPEMVGAVRDLEHLEREVREEALMAPEQDWPHPHATPPWDHNGECLFCDEHAAHAADCTWLLEILHKLDHFVTLSVIKDDQIFELHGRLTLLAAEIEEKNDRIAALARRLGDLEKPDTSEPWEPS